MHHERSAMNAGEAVVEALQAEGVQRVYSVPGSHIHPIYDALSRVNSIKLVTCKLEPNVSLMAEAHGRLSGKPGVCIVTAGPGAVNSMAGVAQAYGAASPMVHISGAVPLNAELECFHGVDDPAFVNEMFKPITKWTARVERLTDVPEALAKAFHIARSGRPGPVHVELPRLSDYSEFVLQEAPAILSAYKSIPTAVATPRAGRRRPFCQLHNGREFTGVGGRQRCHSTAGNAGIGGAVRKTAGGGHICSGLDWCDLGRSSSRGWLYLRFSATPTLCGSAQGR